MFSCFKKKELKSHDILDVSIHGGIKEKESPFYLDSITYKDTIPYVHQLTIGKVVKVYDGDTITIASKLAYPDSPIYRFSIRLRGIDTPEIKSKCEKEKELAKKAQEALSSFVLDKIVTFEDVGMDKYGRVLANVYYDKINLSQWMLQNGHAVEYDGGKKYIPKEWANEEPNTI